MMTHSFAAEKNDPVKSTGCTPVQLKEATEHCGAGHLNSCEWPQFNCAGGKNHGLWEATGRGIKIKKRISVMERIKKSQSRSNNQ